MWYLFRDVKPLTGFGRVTFTVTIAVMKTFGEYARQQIRMQGKSQKALAKVLGVSPAYVSQIFTGKKNPPDLGRPRNRHQLKVWCEFLNVAEDDILEMVRYELHRVPPRPAAKFRNMRRLLITRLAREKRALGEEMRVLELHPGENAAVQGLVQVYLVLQQALGEDRAYGATRFKQLCGQARANKEFVEKELVDFFDAIPFNWAWDPEVNEVRFYSESADFLDAIDRINALVGDGARLSHGRTVPVVGHVSAGEGFEFTDGGYPPGEGFEQVDLPPGVDPTLGDRLYCVRVRGDSLREFINEGSLLYIKPESWEEVRDGDLVIFKDRALRRAFVKKVEFAGENLILRSLNPLYKNVVVRRSELVLLERVLSVVF